MTFPPRSGPTRSPRTSGLLALALLSALPWIVGCASDGAADGARPDDFEEKDFVPIPLEGSEVAGLMLELDKTLKAWQQAVVDSNATMVRRMELILRSETNDSFDEVVQGLESPAPGLRQTAAAALGFSGREEALSPLSNALSDPDPQVLANALIGLGQLADPRSPVAIIAYHLRSSSDPLIRSNAAYALGQIAGNGGARETEVYQACRQGLYDDFAGVRSQCASVLGQLADTEAIADLGALLDDEEDLAAKPAILALGEIARTDAHSLGEVARTLADGMGRAKRNRKGWLRAELVRISERDFEGDLVAWKEWAYSLP